MPSYCVVPPALTTITRTVTAAGGRFAPGHLGELTTVVPFELVLCPEHERELVVGQLLELVLCGR